MDGRVFNHQWQLEDALAEKSVYWRQKENDKDHNAHLRRKIDYICKMFRFEKNYRKMIMLSLPDDQITSLELAQQ